MKLDSKQFVPFVLVIAFIGLVAIVFSSFNFNSKQLETFSKGLQEGTEMFLGEYVTVLQTGFMDEKTDSLQLESLSDESILLLFAARWSEKSADIAYQVEQIMDILNTPSLNNDQKALKLVVALVLDTREGYDQELEREKLSASNGFSYQNDYAFSEQHLIIDGSYLFNEFQVPGIPTLIYLKGGQILWTHVGFRNSSQLEPLNRLLGLNEESK